MIEPRMSVRFSAVTSDGLVRSHNEDAYLTAPPVFLVADGMGGHARGEVASMAAVNAFLSVAAQRWATSDDIVAAVSRASEEVRALAGTPRPPGSTITGVAMSQQGGFPCWLVFNVGDSRTYLFRGGKLEQITVDHSVIKERPDSLVGKNVITRALGGGLKGPVNPDQWLIPAQVGDVMLICSDGLTNEVSDESICETLTESETLDSAVSELVNSALNAGGRDNITVILVYCDEVVSDSDLEDVLEGDTASNEEGSSVLADDTIPDEQEENHD